MGVRVLLGQPLSLRLGPHHEGVHRPPDPGFTLPRRSAGPGPAVPARRRSGRAPPPRRFGVGEPLVDEVPRHACPVGGGRVAVGGGGWGVEGAGGDAVAVVSVVVWLRRRGKGRRRTRRVGGHRHHPVDILKLGGGRQVGERMRRGRLLHLHLQLGAVCVLVVVVVVVVVVGVLVVVVLLLLRLMRGRDVIVAQQGRVIHGPQGGGRGGGGRRAVEEVHGGVGHQLRPGVGLRRRVVNHRAGGSRLC